MVRPPPWATPCQPGVTFQQLSYAQSLGSHLNSVQLFEYFLLCFSHLYEAK